MSSKKIPQPLGLPSYWPMKTRDTPKQERARQRVATILDTAARVLESRPPDELSANVIAEVAGIPVSSIYRYFPTVQLLIEELYLHAADRLKAEALNVIAGDGPWSERLVRVLLLIREFSSDHPYYRALLILIAAHRGPQNVTHDFNQEIIGFLAQRWERGLDGFSGGDPAVVATTVLQLMLSFEELLIMQDDPEKAHTLLTEFQRVIESYMAPYFKA